ncbi:ATP-binding protein [[Leptolyngbya] sp. PCC 7376]|uniref:ATP-binding protein n=1 Tax=[Leptolyngbya] sp. PCC 7376 TaxID=111781 RepID=UPI00031F80AB|nr:ATP-binding protein [[Leptolyngbya] sp. PCC 7376]
MEESDDFSISWSWVWVATLYFFAAGTLSASFLSFEGKDSISARLMFRLFGLGAIATAVGKTREVQYFSKYSGYREVLREDNFISKFVKSSKKTEAHQTADADEEEIAIYDWQRLRSEATGIMIAGNPGHGKSSVALWSLGWLTQLEAAHIEICDPHAGVNRGWAENGFNPVSNYGEIEQKFKDALAEFKARKTRAEQGQDIGRKFILVADETDGYEDNFEDADLVSRVQTVLGKEGRKYGIILIFITHTANVTNKKIDAQERDCFTSINLGVSAMAKAQKTWGKKSEEYKLLKQQVYPCVVVSNGVPALAIHPTHAEYTEFKTSGNLPKNLLPVHQIHDFGQPHGSHSSHTQPHLDTNYVDRLYSLEFDLDSHSSATQPQEPQLDTESSYICPECGSHSSKWHDRRKNRRKCKDCNNTWTIKD